MKTKRVYRVTKFGPNQFNIVVGASAKLSSFLIFASHKSQHSINDYLKSEEFKAAKRLLGLKVEAL